MKLKAIKLILILSIFFIYSPIVRGRWQLNLARVSFAHSLFSIDTIQSNTISNTVIKKLNYLLQNNLFSVQVNLILGQAYVAIGEDHDAIQAFKTGLQKDGRNILFLYNLGWVYYKQEEKRLAIDIWSRIPNILSTFIGRGNAYVRDGNFEEAVNAYKRATLIAPDSVLAHFSLGYAYEFIDVNSAIAAYQTAIQLDQKHGVTEHCSDCYARLGLMYLWQGSFDVAEETLLQAINLNQDHWQAHFWLAHVYYSKGEGNFDLAAQEIQRAIELSDWVRQTQPLLIGQIFEASGQFKKATCWYILLPDNPQAREGVQRIGQTCDNNEP